jgi:HAD superfamily phosphoserine phosphatase-like hydrolase
MTAPEHKPSRKKLVVFDMDETLITTNTWLRFNTYLGVSEEEDFRLYAMFSKKEITYIQWLEELVRTYDLENKSVTRSEIHTILSDITLADGAKQAVNFCKENDLIPVLITGSFDVTAEAVATKLGIKHYTGNTLCEYDNEGNLCNLVSAGDEGESKVRHLKKFCVDLNVSSHSECVAVGDSSNDIPLFNETNSGITFIWSKPEVKAAAAHLIESLAELPQVLKNFKIN